ncbi:hypothetical protein PAXINDRAFT_103257 [Paxillus involutus ATCC 200175]|uniref:Unplaced genomic scaffold PAXINscaffold_873, whole genome shotgun sequence n=1 Tax=Paxillus involutus ATCC 200175 TaxID=664439 RepID=A0A0C9SVP2_PAXIN|nr:hypothetical protein PAXINDRAFT_103257 [Paxillus involutus ATCC 200175]
MRYAFVMGPVASLAELWTMMGTQKAPNPPALKLAARRSQIGFPNITDPDQAMQDERADFFCSDAELR